MLNDYKISVNDRQSPLSCYNRLYLYRERKKAITPEICQKFLQQSDNHKIINELLNIVSMQLEEFPQEYPQYRKFLLGCIIGRTCREDNVQKITEIQRRFSKVENSNIAEYILTANIANHLKIDKTKELKQIMHYLSQEDIALITKELEYQAKINQVREKQQKILKSAKQQAEGKEVKSTTCSEDYSCAIYYPVDLNEYGAIKFEEDLKRIHLCASIPQTSNLGELKNFKVFCAIKLNLTDYVVDLPESTEYVSLNKGYAPKELNLSHLPKLRCFRADNEDFSNTSVFFPYGQELEELMLFNVKKFPDEFDLTVFSSIQRFRTDCLFSEHLNCRLPHRVNGLELAQIKKENGIIDFSSIKQVKHFSVEEAKLGENVEIRFPQQVETVTFDHTCESIPKRLNLNVKGLKKITIDTNVQHCVEEIILPQGFDLSLLPELRIKITYVEPKKKESMLQKKPTFWEKIFFKTGKTH